MEVPLDESQSTSAVALTASARPLIQRQSQRSAGSITHSATNLDLGLDF